MRLREGAIGKLLGGVQPRGAEVVAQAERVPDLVHRRVLEVGVDELRSLGCRFALDDFGTGFCSYGHLRALDVDFIKIDGSFVQDMCSSPLSAEVVGSITRIAHLLRKRTIAEHTESESVRAALAAIGVDYAQGYAIDHPQPLRGYLAALVKEPLAS